MPVTSNSFNQIFLKKNALDFSRESMWQIPGGKKSIRRKRQGTNCYAFDDISVPSFFFLSFGKSKTSIALEVPAQDFVGFAQN
jgi:hypothetical protein